MASRTASLQKWAALGLLSLLVAPLLYSLALVLASVAQLAPWQAWLDDRRTPGAIMLTLWTGAASAWLAWLGTRRLLQALFFRLHPERTLRPLSWMLSVPHASFAIGMLLLLAPSGWFLRWVSPWATGLTLPPTWITTQDPWGLSLMATLVLKEIPFLLWTASTHWLRDDVRRQWQAEHALAMSLGYAPVQAWRRVVWPQLQPRLLWPMAAVLAYSLTVVDVALVIGPSSPPTLAVLVWQWLKDADPAINLQGTAGAVALALLVALVVSLTWAWMTRRRIRVDGVRGSAAATTVVRSNTNTSTVGFRSLTVTYGLLLLTLTVQSVAGWWPFPDVWPQQWTLHAWRSVAGSSDTLVTTLTLGLCSTALALLWCVAWLEWAPGSWDRRARPLVYLTLALPAVTWVAGLYALVLRWQLEGQWVAVLLGHVVVVTPYVLLTLSPAYLAYDPRQRALAASLGHSPWSHLWRIKWPGLRRSMAASTAVGFAVSVAQYLPTLYLGAGRHATVTTEAVALAAGGQRSLAGAYAWLQIALPAMAFAWATWAGRPRRFTVRS